MSISLKNHEDRIKVLENKISEIQNWTNVLSSRSLNTVYTNSTNNPIAIAVSTTRSPNITFSLFVDDIMVSQTSKDFEGYNRHSIFTIVPPGSTYKVTCNVSLEVWVELR